jgi:glycosyltransferase involved in cell wall biosynthesis
VRIAFLTHEPFHPPSGGGSAEAVYLVREFVQRGHAVDLFCPDFENRAAVAAEFGVTIHPFQGWKMGRYTPLRNLKYLLYPIALTKQVESVVQAPDGPGLPDLLFSQHTIASVAAGRLKARLNRPTVFNFLDCLTGFMETWPAWKAPRPLVRLLTRFELGMPSRYAANGILTVSTPLAERFARAGFPAHQIRAIQYGYDASLFRPNPALTSQRSPNDPPVVVMHGSFDQHHLGPIARTAVARIAAAVPGVVFRLVGKETAGLKAFVGAMRSQVPGIRIECTGFIPYASVPHQLQTADVGIVPYEPSTGTHCAFVAKAVEYLGCGLPVVSTSLENLCRHFAEEPAIRFAGFDGEAFARSVIEVLKLPRAERDRMGLAASARVAATLDWSRVTAHAAEFVESVLIPSQRANGLGSRART